MTEQRVKHNHEKCVEQALEAAHKICEVRETRFTPLRRRVLELVWKGHKPVSAYELIELLSQEKSKSIAPPTVYRALEFLIEEGLVHRIESLNAFIGCPDPHHPHQGHFLICKTCRTVTEINESSLVASFRDLGKANDFVVQESMLEVMGLCRNCQ